MQAWCYQCGGVHVPNQSSFTSISCLASLGNITALHSGPAGLFAAYTLAQAGMPVVLLERGQPVEARGRDIGALFVRGLLNPDSNLCYGEGGAGTCAWEMATASGCVCAL